MTDISVDVTITNEVASYKSSDPQVQADGTITIDSGEDAVITFEPVTTGQGWSFSDPWIAISPTGGDVVLVSGSASAVVIQDNNPKNTTPSQYTYQLHVNVPPYWLDPRVINKGSGS
jgi:hypothetical protein